MTIEELVEDVIGDDQMSGVPRYRHRYDEDHHRLAAALRDALARNERLRAAIAEHKRRCVEDDHEPTEHEGMAVFTSTVDLWSVLDTP